MALKKTMAETSDDFDKGLISTKSKSYADRQEADGIYVGA
jgi:hypothetical protein